MRGLYVWADKIETTQPTDTVRTFRAGRKHATLYGVPIPFVAARAMWRAWLIVTGRKPLNVK